ncbi:MAG: TonB-dependent receptor [Rhodanobacteraceae bacterium]
MKNDKLIRLALASAILAALSPAVWAGSSSASAAGEANGQAATGTAAPQATAANPPAKTSQSGSQTLQTVVVTASAVGVKKLDASYNIVTANRAQIQEANPISVADLLKISPGIWPESSGGQTGANIEIAGFPGGGDAPFFTNMINGTPLYGMPSMSFMESSSMMRLDDTISRVEIVQGGPGAVFGPGQMGATANFILRQGTATPSGDVGVTYGDEGMYRLDGFYGFPIGKSGSWFGSIGGFYLDSNGVRNPQAFPADVGGQLTATLSHDWDSGSFMLWARVLNEKNLYVTPIPMIQTSGDKFVGYPGFNPLTSTYYSGAIQNVMVPSPLGGFQNANLANGRGTQMSYLGGSYNATFGGWEVYDHFLLNVGNLPTNALFSGPNPSPLGYYMYGCNVAQPQGWCSASGKPFSTNNTLQQMASRNITATLPNGQQVPLSQSVIQQGWWYVNKKLKSLNNDFRLTREIFAGNTLTLGLYLARYTDHDLWSLGNDMLMLNEPNTQPIGLTYVENGHTYVLANAQGMVNMNSNTANDIVGTATNKAFYASDSWTIGPWLLQAGGRVENLDARERYCNTTPVALGSPYDLFDDAVPVCNGTWTFEHYDKTHPSFTVGANYTFNSNMSAYVRANTGAHFDDFDNGILDSNGNFAPMQKIKNMEAGFKFQSDTVFVDVSIYHRLFTGLQYQETNAAGVPIFGAVSNYGANSHGLDLNGTWSPIENLRLKLVADYMDGHYTHDDACEPFFSETGAEECISFDGAPLQRQPKVRYLFMPSYTLPTGWGSVMGFLTYEYAGQRYEDQSGLQPIGTFYTLGAGVVANVGADWQFRVQGTNLTNSDSLTEGNSRLFGVESGLGGVLMARPIFGREVWLQAKYRF